MNALQNEIDDLNERYLELHRAKEEAFWETRMGIRDRHEDLARAEIELKNFLGDPSRLTRLRSLRAEGKATPPQAVVLDGWILMMSRNQIEDPEARELFRELVQREGELQQSRGGMKLGLRDPKTGEFQPATSVYLGNLLRSDPDPARREAAFEGMRSIETHVLANGYPEIVKLRNRFARKLGFADFYEYKVWWSEGFDKKTLFGFLDDLERRTKVRAAEELRGLEHRIGREALRPWNLNFHTWGSVQEERDPYFGFEEATDRWVRSFAALGVKFRNARITLDLLDRKGKYENGFMHGPTPAFFRKGTWLPAEINFTANAVIGQVGGGFRAAETLFHEGGHAAHFANVLMDAPCFSQEYAPTSVATGETQSMFMDRLLDDADWQTRYAKDGAGRPIPFDLIERTIRLTHPFEAQNVRSLLTVCYAEKALYEAPESELTPAAILSMFREVERRLVLLPEGCPRPTLAVPHLLDSDASCYYHGYVLAQMAVAQTRTYFFEKYGHIVDNENVGADLARVYWKPGNSKSFLDLVQEMTGRPFSADALVAETAVDTDEVVRTAKTRVAALSKIPEYQGTCDLDARIRMIHGAEIIVEEGKTPREAAEGFRDWILAKSPGETVSVTSRPA